VDAKGEDVTGDLDAIDSTKPDADLETEATGDAGAALNTDRAPLSGSQEQNADPSANALARVNGGTSGNCNNMTCYCAIA